MKVSNIIITVIWALVIVIGIGGGLSLPTSKIAQDFPSLPPAMAFSLPVAWLLMSFCFGREPSSAAGKWIDNRLRIRLLFATMGFLIGSIGLIGNWGHNSPSGTFTICGFFLIGSLAFLIDEFVISRRRRKSASNA